MTTTDFNMPVAGVTGIVFRNNLSAILAAMASTNESSADPPVTYAGMLQAKTTSGIQTLRVRNAANTGWVVLFPDLSAPYGGIIDTAGDTLTEGIGIDRNVLQSTFFRDGWSSITSTPPDSTTTQIIFNDKSRLVNLSFGAQRSSTLNGQSGLKVLLNLPPVLRPQHACHGVLFLQGVGTGRFVLVRIDPATGDVLYLLDSAVGPGSPTIIGEIFYYARPV